MGNSRGGKREPHWILEATQTGADCLIANLFNAAMLRTTIVQIGGKLQRQLIDRSLAILQCILKDTNTCAIRTR